MNYKFIGCVDKEQFDVTRGAWVAQLDRNPENTSSVYYTAGLEYCERILDGSAQMADGGGCISGVAVEGSPYAAALIVVSHAKAQKDLKMLDIFVQPELNLADAEPNYEALAWIAATAITGCLELTYDTFPSRQLKVHTAFPLDREFMVAVSTAIFGKGPFSGIYEITSHNNWLVLTKKIPPVGSVDTVTPLKSVG